jgi:hypothetical protein
MVTGHNPPQVAWQARLQVSQQSLRPVQQVPLDPFEHV